MVGLTFASLRPERVSWMVLDGIANPNDWTSTWPMAMLPDSEAICAGFFTDCFSVQKSCPLWRDSNLGAAEIEQRVDTWLEDLRKISSLHC